MAFLAGKCARVVKRAVDVVGASSLLIAGAPVLAVGAAAVRVCLGRPVLFKQVRPGRNGELFTLYKLRTMRDGEGDDRARLTPLGSFLRATSIDELPQLWNVLRGEMSLVGPRPLLVEYLGRYSPEQARRHEVLPGITGLAQVRGRNTVQWKERLALDVWYVDHWNLPLDLRILLETLGQVLARKGISAPGEASMKPFMGKDAETQMLED